MLVAIVWASTNDAALSKCDIRIVSPANVIYSTNSLTGGNVGWTEYHILTNDLPAVVSCSATQSWVIERTAYVRSGHTNAIGTIRWNLK
jgi:hypothetical protein